MILLAQYPQSCLGMQRMDIFLFIYLNALFRLVFQALV